MPLSVRAQALRYLQRHHVVTLATHGSDGVWAAAVFYVCVGTTLYFLSSVRSRHAQHLAAQPAVAITIHENYRTWGSIKGLQGAGRAARVPARERARAWRRYIERFPELRPLMVRPGVFRIGGRETRPDLWRIRLTHLYFLNNAKGFGHRDPVTP